MNTATCTEFALRILLSPSLFQMNEYVNVKL
jgi:hypothetical protein